MMRFTRLFRHFMGFNQLYPIEDIARLPLPKPSSKAQKPVVNAVKHQIFPNYVRYTACYLLSYTLLFFCLLLQIRIIFLGDTILRNRQIRWLSGEFIERPLCWERSRQSGLTTVMAFPSARLLPRWTLTEEKSVGRAGRS